MEIKKLEKMLEFNDLKQINGCPECKSKALVTSGYSLICRNCGIVIEEESIVPEIGKIFEKEKKLNIAPLNTRRVKSGKLITGKIKRNMDLGYIETNNEKKVGYVYLTAINFLKKISNEDKLNLPNPIINNCIDIILKIITKGDIKIANYKSLVLGLIYNATKNTRYTKTIVDLVEYCNYYNNEKSIHRYIKITDDYFAKKSEDRLGRAKAFVDNYCSQFELPKEIRDKALKLVKKIKLERRAIELAAAAVYIATRETEYQYKVTQQKLAKNQMTETPLRNTYKEMINKASKSLVRTYVNDAKQKFPESILNKVYRLIEKTRLDTTPWALAAACIYSATRRTNLENLVTPESLEKGSITADIILETYERVVKKTAKRDY